MSKRGHLLGALAVFTTITLVTFRPLFFRWNTLPTYHGGRAGMAEADRNLNVWILALVAHALTTEPTRLFQGNILYPGRDTLAGSEHMLAHVPFTVPAWLLSHNAAYVLKAMMLESLVLTALAVYVVVRHHTGDAAAAVVAGTLLTLSPWRFEPRGVATGVAAEPQYLGFQFLPLALLALDVWLTRGRPVALVGFTVAMALQALASFYLGYAAFSVVPVYAAALLLAYRERAAWRRAAGLVAGVAVAALLVVPAALPYLRLRGRGVVPVYGLEWASAYSIAPWSYLTPQGAALVGPVALVLGTGLGVVRLGRWLLRRPSRIIPAECATWALLATGLVLGAGPYVTLPGGVQVPLPLLVLWRLVPGFSAMRGPGRYVVVVALALALASGYALAALRVRLGRARWVATAALVVFTVAWCSWRPVVPQPSGVGADAPAVYRFLAARPPGEPVVELPVKHGEDDVVGLVRDSRYTLAATVHWQPLLNGYTAYEPPIRSVLAALAGRLPDGEALDRLVSLVDLRWVVVHRRQLASEERAAWEGPLDGLVLAERWGDDLLYAVTMRPRVDRRAGLADRRGGDSTLEGTPRRPLPPGSRSGGLTVSVPASLRPSLVKQRLTVRIENPGTCVWPALDVGREHLVMLDYAWLDGARVVGDGEPGPLGGDVPPGTARTEPLWVYVPNEAAHLRLRVALRQQGDGGPLAVAEAPVRVLPAGG